MDPLDAIDDPDELREIARRAINAALVAFDTVDAIESAVETPFLVRDAERFLREQQ